MERKISLYKLLLLWLLLPAALLSSCTERSLELRPEPEPEPEPVAIRLYTGIRTRAAVDAFEGTPICVAYGNAPGVYTECWDGVATGNEITLSPARYYPQDGSRVYLRSFYPPAPMNADGTLIYTLTGEEDLLMTSECVGSLDSPFTMDEERQLTHRHLLTQLSFSLKLDVADDGKYSVRALSLNGLTRQVTLSLLTEELSSDVSTLTVTVYEAPADNFGLPFEDGVADLPGYVLVQPEAEFTIDLRLAVDDNPANDLVYTNLPVQFEGGVGEGGVAYTVKVDIPDPVSPAPVEVSATATVTSWKDGNGGSGEIVPDKEKK